jgi:hypothetical protein
MTTPTRYAAIYARASTEDQGRGYSIPTQIEGCQKLMETETGKHSRKVGIDTVMFSYIPLTPCTTIFWEIGL